MRKTNFFLTVTGCFIINAVILNAAEYYVSSSQGNDANPGTFDRPWKTISKANGVLKAGDIASIRAGKYAETILPVNSGVAGMPIVYKNYNSEIVEIGGGIQSGALLIDKSYIKLQGLKFSNNNDVWIRMKGGGHHIVIGCQFNSAAGSTSMGWAGFMIESSDYNHILENTLSSLCQPKDLLDIYGGYYNLVENNSFGTAAHTALALQEYAGTKYNVVRGNVFRNTYHSNLGVFGGGDYSLVENNILLDAGDVCGTDSCPGNVCGSDRDIAVPRWNNSGTQIGGTNIIYRNNVLINNGKFTVESLDGDTESLDNRIYHNTFYKNYNQWKTSSSGPNPLKNNVAKNNIFYDGILYNLAFNPSTETSGNQFVNNVYYGAAPITYLGKSGISEIESAYPALWSKNFKADPLFFDPLNRDLKLKAGSPLINAADWLTTVISASGSGSKIAVADAKYFMDGWGIIEGDLIQLEGQTQTARITAVDYAANIITVDRSISWQKGQGVSLPYNGSKPDIGAYEYVGNSGSPPPAPEGLIVK